VLRKLTAVVSLFLLMTSIFAPIAFGVVNGGVVARDAAKAPKCRAGTILTKTKKRVRVTVKVRVHGKLKRKRVWKKRWVLVCTAIAPTSTAAGDRTAPTTPSGLEAAAGRSQVVLVWNSASDNVGVTGYRISRNGAVVSTVPSTSFTDTGLANGTRYDYQVSALDAAGNASAPASVSSTPQAPGAGADTQAPSAAPSFTAVAGDRQVALSWGASTDNVKVVYYELRRDGAPISFQEGTTFTDTGLANGTAYAYTVIAYDQAGNASVAATANATPADTTAPGTPAGLAAIPGDAQVSLTWTAPTDNVAVTGYRVYRGGVLVASPATPYHLDTAVTNGTAYSYTVSAVDGSGNESPHSTAVMVTPQAPIILDTTPPGAPPSFTATPGDRKVDLAWNAASDNTGVTAYEIYRGGVQVAVVPGLSYSDTGLTNGTLYSYTVKARDAAGNVSTASAASATPADTTAPTVPSGLAATPGDAQVTLSWNASTDNVGVTGYKVYRGGVLVASPATPYYVDTGLTNDTAYSYKVAAVDGSGNASAQSGAVSATPVAPIVLDTTAPSVPGGLATTPGNSQVALNWTASTDNVGVTGYKVYRDGVLIAQPSGTTLTDTGLTNGTTYSYRVSAVDAAGNASAQSSPVSGTPADTQAPTTPSAVTATPGDTQVSLSWTPSTDNVAVTGYRVYRDGSLIASPGTPFYTDTGLTNGTSYSYRIAAADAAANTSPQSSPVSATPVAPIVVDTTPPSAPPGLSATAGDRQVALSWSAATDNIGVTGYDVYRGAVLVASPAGTSYTDTGLANGTLYSYTVKARDAAGNVSTPSSASATPADTTAPTVPSGLTATPGDAQVSLSWTASTDNVAVTAYRVYRGGVLIASPATPYYTDTGLSNGTAYSYKVAAVDGSGNASAQSGAASATPVAPPDTTAPSVPTGLTATPGSTQVALSWTASTDNVGVTGYRVYRGGVLIAAPTGTSYTDTGLTNGTAYSYKIAAVDAAGNASAQTAAVSGTPADTTAPSVPAGLAATPGDAQVALSWTASTDNVAVTGYKVYRGGVLVASPATPYYVDTGLTNGTAYSYKVAAVDGSGNASAQSGAVSATPVAAVVPDTTAPSAPGSLVGTPGTGSASLTWTASTDNVGVTGYKVYRGGVLVGSPVGPSYTDTGLTNGTAYLYTVKATDAAGNLSAASNQVSVTPGDTQAPTVPTNLALVKNAANHSITFSWSASTDNIAVTKYRVYRKVNTGAYTMIAQPTGTSYADIDLSNGRTYTYTVEALDAAGNVSAQAPAISTYVS